jgi:hypothetical protein
VLVRTGKYINGHETAFHPAPSHIADDLADAIEKVVENAAFISDALGSMDSSEIFTPVNAANSTNVR